MYLILAKPSPLPCQSMNQNRFNFTGTFMEGKKINKLTYEPHFLNLISHSGNEFCADCHFAGE